MMHEEAPQDRFKETHVAKQGIKAIPNKINDLVHCDDDALLKQPDITSGYRNKTSWTMATNETRCRGNDRTFDKIVASGHAREAYELSREKKLEVYHN